MVFYLQSNQLNQSECVQHSRDVALLVEKRQRIDLIAIDSVDFCVIQDTLCSIFSILDINE